MMIYGPTTPSFGECCCGCVLADDVLVFWSAKIAKSTKGTHEKSISHSYGSRKYNKGRILHGDARRSRDALVLALLFFRRANNEVLSDGSTTESSGPDQLPFFIYLPVTLESKEFGE
jgi:hypothetical protein